jgi:hypothetical protein
MTKAIVSLWGTGTLGKSRNVTSQRRVNVYAENLGDADKTPRAFYSRPGLLKGFNDPNSGSASIGGPMRGLIVVPSVSTASNETVYAAQADRALQATYSGRFLAAESFFQTTAGPVQFANNGTATIAVDGVTGYLMGTGSMAVAGVADFPNGARSLCFIAGRFVVDDPTSSGKFRWCGVYDHTDWDPLNFATAESNSDPLVQVFERGGELLLFGNRTIEFWAPTGDANVFLRTGGAGIDWGLAIFDTVRKANDSVFFIGRNLGGQPQVCRLDGYQARVVSTPDVDYRMNAAITAGAQVATSVVTHSGHTWYIVNLADTSLVYDVMQNEWSEWQTADPVTGIPARWAGQYSSQYRNTAIVTDYRDGRVYFLDAERYTDDVTPIPRELISRHAFANLDELTCWEMQLDIETGVGLYQGQGSDPQIMLRISKDGGHTWGKEMWRPIGKQGQYKRRVYWRRLGIADDWVFHWKVSDPVKTVFMNAAVEFGR